MFIGHFGIGFGAKKFTPAVSLGLLFIAVQFLDLLWPILLLLNIEHVAIAPGITKMTPLDFTYYPITHSLLMAVIWGLVFGIVYWLFKKNLKYAAILGFCVVSHWLLDILVHRPDLPLYPGNSPRFGFGLWNYPFVEIILESIIFAAGFIIYLQKTSAKNSIGKFGVWILALLLVLVQVSNILGPPPPDVSTLAWMGQLQWVFVLLAFWIDRNRNVLPAKE